MPPFLSSFFQKFKDPKFLLKIAVLAAIYFASAKFGLLLAYSTRQVTLIWPPTGISLAALILLGFEYWPGVLVGAFLANITTMETFPIALGIAAGNTLEALVGAYFLTRFNFDKSLTHVRDVLIFVFYAAFFSTLLSAFVGTSSLILGGIGSWKTFFPVFLNWWVGDAIGDMVIAPFILTWWHVPKFEFNIKRAVEGIILFSLLIFFGLFIFTGVIKWFPVGVHTHLESLAFPMLLWASYRFNQKGSALAVLVIAAIAIWGTVSGTGIFAQTQDVERNLLAFDGFASIISLTFLVFSSIVHERNIAENAVNEREKRFSALLENSSDAVFVVNAQGYIKYASPSAKTVTGFSSKELINTSGFRIVYKDDVKITRDTLNKLLANPGKAFSLQNRIVKKDGEVRYMEATGVNLLSEPYIEGIVVNFRDINEKMKLDQVQKEFVSLSAHQLRSPLSIIRWYSESILQKEIPEELKKNLKEIHKASLDMNSTVNLLLDVSRFELGRVKIKGTEVDLPSVLKNILAEKDSPLRFKKIKIIDKTPEKPREIVGDARLIGVILENLVSNAIKYTPERGKIEVSFENQPGNVLFKIKDNGVGIPQSEQSKIFTKMFRGSNVKNIEPGGLGLGLYLVRLIVNLKGGKIWFESREGKGTTFFVEFPDKIKI